MAEVVVMEVLMCTVWVTGPSGLESGGFFALRLCTKGHLLEAESALYFAEEQGCGVPKGALGLDARLSPAF